MARELQTLTRNGSIPDNDQQKWNSRGSAPMNEETVIWAETFFAETFDFRGRRSFRRFDECTFVKCTLLIDRGTEELAFTGCSFKDCNIDCIDHDDQRWIISKGNIFHRPLDEKRKEFDQQLAAALRNRGQG